MANDRLYLKCKICGEAEPFLVLGIAENIYAGPQTIDNLTAFAHEHQQECNPTCGNLLSLFAIVNEAGNPSDN